MIRVRYKIQKFGCQRAKESIYRSCHFTVELYDLRKSFTLIYHVHKDINVGYYSKYRTYDHDNILAVGYGEGSG